MHLSPVTRKFILHWGEMGHKWGINRTVAQIHALLFLSPKPLNAEQISGALSVARSNVSTSLRELQSWGIIRVVHIMGDRRDHFTSLKDVWEMFRIIVAERKEREVDPALAVLQECVAESRQDKELDAHTKGQLRAMLGFFEAVTDLYEQFRDLPPDRLLRLAKLGGKVRKLIGA